MIVLQNPGGTPKTGWRVIMPRLSVINGKAVQFLTAAPKKGGGEGLDYPCAVQGLRQSANSMQSPDWWAHHAEQHANRKRRMVA
jgi:hypothetical protein